MKTNHLQSMLARNAAFITEALQQAMLEKQTARSCKRPEGAAKGHPNDAIRAACYKQADWYIRKAVALAPIQKEIKQELRHQSPRKSKKHGLTVSCSC